VERLGLSSLSAVEIQKLSLKEVRESLYFFLAEVDVLNGLTTGALEKKIRKIPMPY
jgi:hypothetical protein